MNSAAQTQDTREAQLAALAAKHAKEIEKLRAEQKAAEALPDIPGASLHMVHGKLYGVRHFALHVLDMSAVLDFMQAHALPVFAWKGRYAGMYPVRPETRDWVDAIQGAEGVAVISCERALRYQSSGGTVSFFIRDLNGDIVELSFESGGYDWGNKARQKTRLAHSLAPVPQYRRDITRHSRSNRPLEGYAKTGAGVAQHLSHHTDCQGANLKTLCTMDQVREYWTAE